MRVRAAITSSLWLAGFVGPPLSDSGRAGLAPEIRSGAVSRCRLAALVVAARGALNLIVRDLQTGADTAHIQPADRRQGNLVPPSASLVSRGRSARVCDGRCRGGLRIFEQRLDVAGAPRALVEGVWASISRDGRALFVINDVRATGHLSRRAIGSDGSIGSAEPLVPDLDVDDVEPSPDGDAAADCVRTASADRAGDQL